jgi:drug/metabolite transporter (DMT)-like permease
VTAPVLWCLLAAALFGASTPAAKALIGEMSPLILAGLLYLGAALAVLPFAFKGGSPERRRDPVNRRRLAGVVLFGGIVGPAALLYGLRSAPAASASLWLNLETLATTVFALLIFREHIGRRAAVAHVLLIVGGVLLAVPTAGASLAAVGWIALACACWGLDNNLTALIDGYTPAQSTLVKGLVAGTFNLGAGLLDGPPSGVASAALALGLGALAYGVSLLLYVNGAQQLGAARSQMIFSVGPFLGVPMAWLLLDEPVFGLQVVAGVVMLIAVALLLGTTHAHAHRHEAMIHTHLHRHDDGHHTHTHIPAVTGWHTHEHAHLPQDHSHAHAPDLHHRHRH